MPCERQILIRMFSRIHLNLPIESANKNTQNSEMNSACFCSRFSSLKNSRKNGIINSERIISTEDLPCHTTKKRGMRFRHIMKHTILPETSLPLMTKKYTPAQLRIYGKAKKFFAQSWLKLLPETGNKRSMRNFSKNYPPSCLKEGDAAYIADMVAEIMGDEKQFKASIDKFFFDLQEPLEAGLRACAKTHGKTPEELTDEEIEDVVDKLAGLFMEEMINALMTAQKTPEIF